MAVFALIVEGLFELAQRLAPDWVRDGNTG